MPVCFLFCWMGSNPLLPFLVLILIVSLIKLACSFWPATVTFLSIPLPHGTIRCFRFILHLPCPSPRIIHFSKEPWKIVFRSEDLPFVYAHCHWGNVAPSPSIGQKTERKLASIALHMFTFWSIAMYWLINQSPIWAATLFALFALSLLWASPCLGLILILLGICHLLWSAAAPHSFWSSSRFSSEVDLFYKVVANTELVNTQSLLLREIES